MKNYWKNDDVRGWHEVKVNQLITIDCLIEWLIEWLIDWVTDRMTDRMKIMKSINEAYENNFIKEPGQRSRYLSHFHRYQ